MVAIVVGMSRDHSHCFSAADMTMWQTLSRRCCADSAVCWLTAAVIDSLTLSCDVMLLQRVCRYSETCLRQPIVGQL